MPPYLQSLDELAMRLKFNKPTNHEVVHRKFGLGWWPNVRSAELGELIHDLLTSHGNCIKTSKVAGRETEGDLDANRTAIKSRGFETVCQRTHVFYHINGSLLSLRAVRRILKWFASSLPYTAQKQRAGKIPPYGGCSPNMAQNHRTSGAPCLSDAHHCNGGANCQQTQTSSKTRDLAPAWPSNWWYQRSVSFEQR